MLQRRMDSPILIPSFPPPSKPHPFMQELEYKGLSIEGSKHEVAARLARYVAGISPIGDKAKASANSEKGKGKGKAKAKGSHRSPSAGSDGKAEGSSKGGRGRRVGCSDPQPMGTLVVCPMSVIGNWENQLQEHVKEGGLKVSVWSDVLGRILMPINLYKHY